MKSIFPLFLCSTLIISACGSSSDSSPTDPTPSPTPAVTTPPPTPTPTPPIAEEGIFDVDYGQFNGVYAFLDDGSFYGIHFVFGGTLAGHPRGTLTDDNADDNLTAIAWANFIDDAQMLGVQEPDPTFGRTFTDDAISVTIEGSFGTFSTTSSGQKPWFDGSASTLYENPISLNEIAGSYNGVVRTVGIDEPQQTVSELVVDDAGNFTVNVGDCDYTGVVTPHGTSGVYDASATVSGSECTMATTLFGALMPLSFQDNSVEMTIMLNSDDEQFTAVFLVEETPL